MSEWIPTGWMRRDEFENTNPDGPKVQVVRMNSPFYTGERYAVRHGSLCLATNGEWEDEPMPSSRDDAFYERCRFQTFDDAVATADSEEAKT